MVGVASLLWAYLANEIGVVDFSVVVRWNLVKGNGEDGVGAFDMLAFVGTSANALAKAPKFVCIGGVPGDREGGVGMQLAPFKEVSHVFIKD
jgi:hypothetical protein